MLFKIFLKNELRIIFHKYIGNMQKYKKAKYERTEMQEGMEKNKKGL